MIQVQIHISIKTEISLQVPTPRAILTGHEHTISCAVISAELGLVISGSKHGPLLVHTTFGDLLRSVCRNSTKSRGIQDTCSLKIRNVLKSIQTKICCRALEGGAELTSPSSLCLSREGVVVASYPSHHLAVFTVNGKRLRNELHSDNIQVAILSI